MSIRIREASGVSILDVDGRIDINSSDIIEAIGWLINSGKLHIIMNMESVDIVDYNGLSVLAIAYKKVINSKGILKFLNVPLSVMELLKVVRLDSVFESYANERTALDSFLDENIQKMHLRRRFKRLDMHLKVRYRMEGDKKKAAVYEGGILNISGAGVYIYTPNTFPVNSQVEMEFILPDTHAPLEAPGKVIWLPDKQLQPHSYPGMGVGFAHLTAEKEKLIADFIDKNVTYRSEP